MKNFDGKKLLILGGAAIHSKLVKAANQMGVHTIVADYLENSPAKKIASESVMLSITDIDELERYCREQKVDGVLNMCIDPAQRPYSELCERLGLPCYGTPEQFFIMTDKHAFKDFCQKNGVDVIPEYTEEDVRRGEAEFPIMIKPVDSRGSRGQTVIYTADDLDASIEFAKSESSGDDVIIEKFMGGCQDFSMTYFVVNGKPYLTRTCDRYLGKEEDGLNKQCICCVGPSKHTNLYLDMVHEKVVEFIKRLGIINGPIFMQGFIDGNTVRFYDPGLRCPGGEYEALLKELTGADVMSLLVEFALTGKIERPKKFNDSLFRLNGYHTIQLPITARAGTISVFDGTDEISANPYVNTSFKRYEIGETVPSTGDVRQRIYEVALTVDNAWSVEDAVKWVQAKLTVLDENKNNMLVSQVDANILKY